LRESSLDFEHVLRQGLPAAAIRAKMLTSPAAQKLPNNGRIQYHLLSITAATAADFITQRQ
jgi:hypothetical protein